MSMITSGEISSLHSPAKPALHTIFSAKTNCQSKGRDQLNFIQHSDGKTLQIRTSRQPFGDTRFIRHKMRRKSTSSLNATCAALQPLSSERLSRVTIPPIKDEIKAPRLDYNGPRLPPRGGGPGGRGDGGGGRGGEGGYGYLYGGFFLLLLLAFITHLKDQKEENS